MVASPDNSSKNWIILNADWQSNHKLAKIGNDIYGWGQSSHGELGFEIGNLVEIQSIGYSTIITDMIIEQLVIDEPVAVD